MAVIQRSSLHRNWRRFVRSAAGLLPPTLRFTLHRLMVDCDPEPDQRLELKIAETRDELEACFRIVHDAYVANRLMLPDPSGMRVTAYHALPTTTTLCAKYDGHVVGTVSLIRDGVFGFPLQSAFDLEHLRARGGHVAEAAALAIHPDFRKTGGAILFPLLKFVRQYCMEYSDTRHLVIATPPGDIEFYEALLFLDRLQDKVVEHYDAFNGAAAIGAELDMRHAAELFKVGYRGRPPHRNLYRYFFQNKLANITPPPRRYFTTNDPVMTPELLDHFFNGRTRIFQALDARRKSLLWSIYDGLPDYRAVLPPLQQAEPESASLRQHQRFSIRCPASLSFDKLDGGRTFVLNVVEMSQQGFQAESGLDLPVDPDLVGQAAVDLGKDERSVVNVRVVRRRQTKQGNFFGFQLDEPDAAWRRCVAALASGWTASDLI
jgi:GNAT superfamily N-acetyltransferase